MSVKLRGYRDLRPESELLSAPRPPKSVTYVTKNPLTSKLASAVRKVTGVGKTVTAAVQKSTFGSSLLRGAATSALAAGASRFLSALSGKTGGRGLGDIQSATRNVTLGARIVEETNPTNLRRPLIEGPSIDPAAAGKSLSETAARHIQRGLLTGIPVARGVPPKPQLFKTLTKLKASPRFFDAKKAAAQSPDVVTSPTQASEPTLSITPKSVLVRQRSLLEDEIMYRLVLLAENVYQPIADYTLQAGYGAPKILEAFRIENAGNSQHERGEAIDLTWNVGNDALYEIAKWVRDNVMYDQLVLCHTNIGSKQSWLHISFAIEGRRRVVFTKTFDDQFVEGLHLYSDYTDDSLLAADLAKAKKDAELASYFAQTMASRSARLNPIDVSTPEQTSGPASIGGGASGAKCRTHPITGEVYVPINDAEPFVRRAVDELLADPKFLAMAQDPNRREMVEFARNVVRLARQYGAASSGPGAVGMNGVRGSADDPSGDAVAILNPTGAKGAGTWDTDKRVQIMDIVGGAHGGYGSTPTSGWGDETNLCDSGGVFLDP